MRGNHCAWRREMRRSRHASGGSATAGIILMGIGAVFLLRNMGVLPAQSIGYFFREFWPVIPIIIGLKMLVLDRGAGYSYNSQGIGLFWLILGAFFLLPSIPFFNVSFRILWPFVPLAIGAFVLFKVFVDRDDPPRNSSTDRDRDISTGLADAGSNSNSNIDVNVSMGHVTRRSNSQEFQGGSVNTFLGACEIDLRGASPAGGEAVMNISAFLGGIEIKIPTDWTVVNRVSPFLAGVEDRTLAPKDESKKLVLRGSAFLAGVEVRN